MERLLAALDAMDGDTDLEDSHDQEQVCEDEGAVTGDLEPDASDMCHWQDEGDQTVLRQMPVISARRRPHQRSQHENVAGYLAVRVL
ncbi:hypothetical protein [Caulobacter sp. DWP3-1-3b2]|uniref:hypothetical protein n=1 Tax=Caulobacter sp. DWP3-1-3b2 TaxID=2804643 RepID=UPI003CF38BDF